MRNFFEANHIIVIFAYGLTFFTLGLAIFIQSRRYSRLRLARYLRWLAAFGILHGLHAWGDVFIPLQTSYLLASTIVLLRLLRLVLLVASFTCLAIFGSLAISERWPRNHVFVAVIGVSWMIAAIWLWLSQAMPLEQWLQTVNILAYYMLGLPSGLLSAYGLRLHAKQHVQPLQIMSYKTLRIAGSALALYAIVEGIIVPAGPFFPANVLNEQNFSKWVGLPTESILTLLGLVLTLTMIRALDMFEIELDRLIEEMEVDRIQNAERDRIAQEIHDGSIQSIYSASLLLQMAGTQLKVNPDEALIKLDQSTRVLAGAINDLRRYMISLRPQIPDETLQQGLQRLAHDPRFSSIVEIAVHMRVQPLLKSTQIGHILGIVQESLSNIVRHANAHHAAIEVFEENHQLYLRIHDDGQGFDQATVTAGYGLRAIHDRARLAGGTLSLESKIGKGTSLLLVFPEPNSA